MITAMEQDSVRYSKLLREVLATCQWGKTVTRTPTAVPPTRTTEQIVSDLCADYVETVETAIALGYTGETLIEALMVGGLTREDIALLNMECA